MSPIKISEKHPVVGSGTPRTSVLLMTMNFGAVILGLRCIGEGEGKGEGDDELISKWFSDPNRGICDRRTN